MGFVLVHVLFFMSQQLLALLERAVLCLSEKTLTHSTPSRMKKTTELIRDTFFFLTQVFHLSF